MQERKPLYVRLPAGAADKLDRAAFERKVAKQDLVADLVLQHLDAAPRRAQISDETVTVGRAELRPGGKDVLTAAEAAELLQSTVEAVSELAGTGELPGRQVGGEWRFARAALLRWLGA
jgi:excisionase family DNA binding protein